MIKKRKPGKKESRRHEFVRKRKEKKEETGGNGIK